MPMERLAPPGLVVEGHSIAENTVVSIHPYMAHHDPQVWGEDAAAFRPERWLETDAIGARLMERNFLAVSLIFTRLHVKSDHFFSSVRAVEPV